MYVLRKATQKDKEFLKSTKKELSNKNIDEKIVDKKVKKDINNDYRKYKIITLDDVNIGCLLFKKNILYEIYIIPEYRNMGIGTSLITKLIDLNKETYLYVFKDNKEAIKLYKRLDFKTIKSTELVYLMKRIKDES